MDFNSQVFFFNSKDGIIKSSWVLQLHGSMKLDIIFSLIYWTYEKEGLSLINNKGTLEYNFPLGKYSKLPLKQNWFI